MTPPEFLQLYGLILSFCFIVGWVIGKICNGNIKDMGLYDTVVVNCPQCGEEHEFQSKSGDCFLNEFNLENCPEDVLIDVNRHSPVVCDCGCVFEVDRINRIPVKTASS